MYELSEELILLRDTVRKAARDKIDPLAAEIDRLGEFNREVESLLWDLGLLQIMLPVDHGGLDRERGTALCLCVEEIARVCASSALCLIIQAVGSFPILDAGSDEVLERYLPKLSTGRTLAAYLVTEPDAGSDVASIRAVARSAKDGWVLNGVKQFATNGGVAGGFSVIADHQLVAAMIADAGTAVEAGRGLVYRAARQLLGK